MLWTTDANSCYSWAGDTGDLGSQPPPQNALWKFVSDGTGLGVWSQIPVGDSTFSNLLRRTSGCGATIRDTGYYVSGQATSASDPGVNKKGEQLPQIGVVSFNSSSRAWDNETSVGLNMYGKTRASKAVTLPAFSLDGRGLLVVLGGEEPGRPVDQALASFNNITMYDPYIGRWFSQRASGDVPGARQDFCAVAIQGDVGTYEM